MSIRADKDSGVREAAVDQNPEHEPDYRFTLANERTFLAWQRTALGLLAAAVALVQLLPQSSTHRTWHILAGLLTVLAIMAAGMGLSRWKQVDRAIRRHLPLPRNPTPTYLGLGLALLGIIALGLLIDRAVSN